MSPFDLIVPVGGVALIVLVVWLTGGLRTASIADAAKVRYELAIDHPDFNAGDIVLASDRRSALALDRTANRVAALFAMGDRITLRVITPPDLIGARAEGSNLSIDLADFGAQRLVLRLGDSNEAASWAAQINARVTSRPAVRKVLAS